MATNYTLTSQTAASPNWYRTKVDPAAIRALMVKSDAIALRDTVIWLGAMIITATIGIIL